MADVIPVKKVPGGLAEFGAADKVPAGNLPATEWAAETVSQAEAEAGTATTRRAWTAQRVRQAIVAWWNSVSSAWGRGFVASADTAAGRTALGLGNAATRTALGTTGALYSRDSILGTVSQSGGIPTGAIIERGSNANGEYTKYADGTIILSGMFSPAGVSWVAGIGVRYALSPNVTLPASIVSGKLSASVIGIDVAELSAYLAAATLGTTTISNIYFAAPPSTTGTSTLPVSYVIHGRWF